ncbi:MULTISPECIES: DNA translocase FtsK [Asticcacaulis]|uniref:DNA translocase FtsK n=1 Tax=Asticcacaulis TaxID=76890 RepID=UPI001AE55311|nr:MULTISPECIES: DNA translocase FtsK [Asticcacaulis]MBP2159922.1 S-DNA-T family DNA segregation ATPase FtsK/SpoIIIE [Asticcacaulis solisilvae]MDR6800967.1 S-DNA-T family DNA segregation ATPase FtsK/SpoIIIE [Asticcacaulis sp. BE141]
MSSLTLDLWNIFENRMRAVWQSPLMARMRGAFVALGGLATLVALATYHPDDSSLNAVSHAPVRNALGRFGAIISDLSWQSIGLAAWPGAVLMVYFGTLRTFHHDPDQTRGAIRRHALFGILFLLALSAAFGPVLTTKDPIVAQSLGGFWGSGMNDLLASVFTFMRLPAGAIIASVLFAMVALYGFNQTLNLKLQSYLRFAQFLGGGLRATGLGGVAGGLAAGLRANVAAKAKNVQTPKAKKPKAQPVVADEDDDGFETVAELPPAKVAARIQPTVAPTRPAPQPEMAFDDDDGDFGDDGMVPIQPPVTQSKAPAAPAAKQPEFDFLRPSNFKLPDLTILAKPKARSQAYDEDSLRQNARMLESVLAEFGVRGVIDQIRPGPVVTLYELAPAAGVKGARVVALADDIARNMSARSCRVSVVQGRNAIGIELPNQTRETVFFRDLLASNEYERSTHILPMALGETIGGEPYITDLAKMPHLLIAGTTGSGKSVGVNAMILSILYRLDPEQCKFIMIDPKMLELSVYDGIPHLLAPVVTDPKKAVVALKWTVKEMEDRYRRMSKIGVRNIASFNERARATAAEGKNFIRKVQTGFDETGQPVYEYDEMVPEPMPYLVVVVDEVADLMMVAGKDIEGAVQRLAQMARAAGIHLIMATQRPSVDVITGTIKANFPTRISFQVTSKIDSRTILGEQGAEQLLGQGDMLYMAGGGRITRLHGPFVSDGEVEAVAQFLRDQGQPNYLDDVTYGGDEEGGSGEGGGMGEGGGSGDDLYDKAVYFVTFDRKASTSYIQRKLQIGYNRAASLMEKMEQEGVVGPANHVGKRDILVGPPPI